MQEFSLLFLTWTKDECVLEDNSFHLGKNTKCVYFGRTSISYHPSLRFVMQEKYIMKLSLFIDFKTFISNKKKRVLIFPTKLARNKINIAISHLCHLVGNMQVEGMKLSSHLSA